MFYICLNLETNNFFAQLKWMQDISIPSRLKKDLRFLDKFVEWKNFLGPR